MRTTQLTGSNSHEAVHRSMKTDENPGDFSFRNYKHRLLWKILVKIFNSTKLSQVAVHEIICALSVDWGLEPQILLCNPLFRLKLCSTCLHVERP